MKSEINVIYDQKDSELGRDLKHFMERSIECADKVLIICTPTIKRKLELGPVVLDINQKSFQAEISL